MKKKNAHSKPSKAKARRVLPTNWIESEAFQVVPTHSSASSKKTEDTDPPLYPSKKESDTRVNLP